MIALPLWALNILGWLRLNWRLVAYVMAGIVLFILIVSFVRSCGKKETKIDLETVDKINNGNRTERIKELTKVVEDNAEVIKTVDNRSNVAEINVIERNAEIDAKVRAADKAIQEAKSQGKDITAQELDCLLIPENCQ